MTPADARAAADATVPPAATRGPVRIVGTGLLGASIGMALRAMGVEVVLQDPSRTTVLLARDVGAGRLATPQDRDVRLVVVAAPPDVTPDVVLAELEAFPGAVVTDVASVKSAVLDALRAAGADLTRYVGSHPMAGSERSGPTAARPDLFTGRPWVVVGSGASSGDAVLAVRDLAADLGATPVMLDAAAHDDAVALVSHVPQVAASLVAARLRTADPAALDLAGQGLRDVTRVAASDPALWTSILAANAGAVTPVLRALRGDLDALIAALDEADAADAAESVGAGALGTVAAAIVAGNEGVARIPGKHGGVRKAYDVVTVLVPDEPGQLARLLADVGAAGINLEELQLEHAPRQAVGLASISVLRGLRSRLEDELTTRGWRLAG
ncbi:prephenate dehydrogenase [Actinotalea subterranea]|uniref:prephenate dehydrogenase n=1 Tax=Actinotalea subterranea TaxID=2607497 RepID=UPI001FE31A9D|nr:prephenate dehydrogenase [Actinotalea subterranea]